MIAQFKQHIDSSFLDLKNKKLFLAVSGGLDSMVLLHLMHQLHYQISVLHCNFALRGSESDGDEHFVKSICDDLNCTFNVQKFDTKQYAIENKVSIQVAARELRYNWFASKIKTENFDFVLTAHHLDDSLETFLINISRGTGLQGLLGIPSQNNTILRPLLPFSRESILDYAQTNKINWREDSSNATTKYLRNKLRLEVIPLLKQVQPNLLNNFATTLQHLQQSNALVSDASNSLFSRVVTAHSDGLEIDLEQLVHLPNYKAYLYQWLQKYNFKSWDDVYQLVHAESGKKVLSTNYVLLKNRNKLLLHPKIEATVDAPFFIEFECTEVKYPVNLLFLDVPSHTVCNANTIFVDKSLLQYPLIIRKFNKEDSFRPFGFDRSKKVTKFLKDAKLSEIEQQNTWLLCSNNAIIWIINRRLDDRFKVTANTTSIVKITFL